MRPYTARRPYWGQGPVSAFYRTKDEKLFYFTLQAASDWPVLCETIRQPGYQHAVQRARRQRSQPAPQPANLPGNQPAKQPKNI